MNEGYDENYNINIDPEGEILLLSRFFIKQPSALILIEKLPIVLLKLSLKSSPHSSCIFFLIIYFQDLYLEEDKLQFLVLVWKYLIGI